MEKAKKMVLISTENLERMQRMQQQQPRISSNASLTDNTFEKRNSEMSDSEDITDKSVRTPGTALKRLDAEMWRILNLATPADENERWKLYKEILQRYLYFFREAKKRLRNDDDNVFDNDLATTLGKDTVLDDDVDMSRGDDLIAGSLALFAASSSFGKKRVQSAEMIREILDSVPKTYRGKARSLVKHLLEFPPSRISWDRHGLVTINGADVSGANIAELINDAVRERKTIEAIGRAQFARLLHELDTPSQLIGNRNFRIKTSLLPRGSSTLLAHSKAQGQKTDKTTGDTQFVSAIDIDDDDDDDGDAGDKTLKGNGYSEPPKRGKYLLDWIRM